LIRNEAIKEIINNLEDEIIVSANGFISRDLHSIFDYKKNFYMIGSMGLASSIGLGLAIKNPKKKIFVFDGDGNILMNLGSLITIGSQRPKNFIHVIFDNQSHESTGGQPTNSKKISISEIGRISNFSIFKIKNKNELKSILKKIKKIEGPIMLHVIVKKGGEIGGRIELSPVEIKDRFMKSIN
tara:strand:+ start:3784 stop:4335 length:552 start_codon:yes stop_codon:yes gene_type:complete